MTLSFVAPVSNAASSYNTPVNGYEISSSGYDGFSEINDEDDDELPF